MLRPVGLTPMVQVTAQVSPAHGGEMNADSSNRELPEQPWRPETPDSPGAPPPSPLPQGHAHPTPSPGPAPSWVDIQSRVRPATGASKPIAIDRYRKARKSAGKGRRFKKGGVIDEAS